MSKFREREEARERQRAALIALGADPANMAVIANAIERAERRHHRKALQYCNDASCANSEGWRELWETQQRLDLETIGEALPKARPFLFINQDPRGYAMKIDNEDPAGRRLIHASGIARDWGGFGLLCRRAFH